MTFLQSSSAADCGVHFAGLALSDFGRQLILTRLPCFTQRSSRIPEQDAVDSRPWQRVESDCYRSADSLGRLLLHADIWRLRSLLAREESSVYRLSDHAVRTAVARLVQRGVLGLFERASRQQAAVGPSVASPAAAVAQEHPAQARPSSASAPRALQQRRAPSAAAAPSSESTPAVDQRAQADVLTAAARLGTPFCEECARRAAQRDEAIAA